MKNNIIILLTFLYFLGLSSVWAEEERHQLILSALDEVEKRINSEGICADEDYQQREVAISQALKKAEKLLREESFEPATTLAKAKIQSSQPSPSHSFFSDFYLSSPFQALISNPASFSPLYFYDSNDFLWAGPEVQRHTWELGTEISHIKYEEPGVMEEKGTMYGVVGSYTYRGWIFLNHEDLDKFMLKAEVKASWGQVDYDGALSDGTPYTVGSIDDYMLEFRGLVGYDFPILTASTLTPYTGIGYRYLNDGMSCESCDPYGYERESRYLYIPIGIAIISELENGWSIGATVEYDIFHNGKQKSHFSDVHPGYNDLENKQKSGYGIRGSIKLQKKGEMVDFVLEPFIRYWRIKQSDPDLLTFYGIPDAYMVEPKNRSTEIGGKLAVMF